MKTVNYKLILILLLVLAGYSNCGRVTLIPRPDVVSLRSTDNYCLEPPSATIINNTLFVIDKSGSNAAHVIDGVSDPGNDPEKFIRGGAIETFFNKYRNNQYFKWGFIYFRGQEVDSYIRDALGNPLFADAPQMDGAIAQFYDGIDIDGTDYTKSIDLVDRAIRNHRELVKDRTEERHIYNVFFVSDGYPWESETAGPNPIFSDQDPRVKRVAAIKALDPSNIFFSTAYYGRPDYNPSGAPIAIQGLKWLAEAGGGTFADVREKELNFDLLRVGVVPQPWSIKRMRIITYNLNSAFCENGAIGADSDADGICDKDEISYNSAFRSRLAAKYPGKTFSPYDRNSLHPDYSDAFVWKYDILQTGPGLPTCSNKKPDLDFDLLNSCEERLLSDINANGPTTQWTDQMMTVNGGSASPINFDSDGDTFLDVLEFFTFRLENGTSAPVDYTNSETTYIDGFTGGEILWHHRHPYNPAANGPYIYDTRVIKSGINSAGYHCYDFAQDNLPLYDTAAVADDKVSGLTSLAHGPNENTILLYFVATPEEDPNGKGVLYHSYQKLNSRNGRIGEGAGVRFRNDDGTSVFSKYKVPKTN